MHFYKYNHFYFTKTGQSNLIYLDYRYNLLKAPVWKLLDSSDVVKNWVLPLLVICESSQLKCHLGLVKVCRANPEGANVTAQCTNKFLYCH